MTGSGPPSEGFSQFGEDLALLELLPQRTGFYVDVGAYHPSRYSNTHLLHERGWRGITVDLHPTSVARMAAARPDDVSLCCAVGRECGRIPAYLFGDGPAPIHTIDLETADLWAVKFGSPYTVGETEAHTLDCILDRHAPEAGVDLVSIDVEGAEADVLAGFDLGRWAPQVVAIEMHLPTGSAIEEAPLAAGFTAAGYALHAYLGVTALFVRAI